MKKLLLSVAVILIAVSASAKRPTGLNLGGGLGINFMCLPQGSSSFVGPYAEVGYDFNFDKHNSLYVGGRYSALYNASFAWGTTISGNYTELKKWTCLTYFDIPVKYRFNFSVSPSVKLYFDAGPSVNFWLSARSHQNWNDIKHPGSVTYHNNWFNYSGYNRVNLSLGGSIGVDLNNHVKIYVGYDQGLFSCTGTDKWGYSNVGQLRIGAAYIF